MKYILLTILSLCILACNKLDDSYSVTITDSHWLHDNVYENALQVSPFDFRTDRTLVLRGLKTTTVNIAGDSTVTIDTVEMQIKSQRDIYFYSGNDRYGLASISGNDFTYFALQSLILAITSDSLTPFWETIKRESNAPVFDSCEKYLEIYGENIIVINTDPLYLDFKATFQEALGEAADSAIRSKDFYKNYLALCFEDSSYNAALQAEVIAHRRDKLILEGIFLDTVGTVKSVLNYDEKVMLDWFNLHFLFYGIVQNAYRREMTLTPKAMQYHVVSVITTTYPVEGTPFSDTIEHLMGHSNQSVTWLESISHGSSLVHNSNSYLPTYIEGNITEKEVTFLPLHKLPILSWSDISTTPITGFATVHLSQIEQVDADPYSLNQLFSLYHNGKKGSAPKIVSGDICSYWHFIKRKKSGLTTAEDEYFGEIQGLNRLVRLTYLDEQNRSCSLKESLVLGIKEWQK